MCGGPFVAPKIPKDDSAERARAEEAARQARIAEGQKNIDNTFAQFNDPYFDKISGDYTGYYAPQLDEQYAKAREKTTLGLARTGNLNASSGAERIGDLAQAYGREQAALSERALQAANELRTKVEENRSDLYGLNRGAADPGQALSLAAGRAGTLSAPQAFSPLADVFGGLVNQGAIGLALESKGYPGLRTGLFGPSKSGSPSVGNVK